MPITNREILELVFVLLDRGRTSFLAQFSVEYIARVVGVLYINKISRAQSILQRARTIPGEPGEVVRRRCSYCKRRVLDDGFPLFSTERPSVYLIEVPRIGPTGGNGCGQENCKGKPSLTPIKRGMQDYTRMETRAMDQTTRRKSNWKAPLCRNGQYLEGCPESIRVRCRGSFRGNHKIECGLERDYCTPEWTIHSPPRLVQPRLKCVCDGKTRDHYFEPVDGNVPFIQITTLRKVYQGFLNAGCDLADYPKLPQIIFNLEPSGNSKKRLKSYQERFQDLKQAKIALGSQ